MDSDRPPISLEYRIAIICALKLEADQVRAVFDTFWADHPEGDGITKAHGDTNIYTTGKIGAHNVVLAHMPQYGKGTSASVAANIRHTFPDIILALVVGICGGMPRVEGQELFLGDVVISNSIVEYDLIKQYPNRSEPINTLGDSQNQEVKGFLVGLQEPVLKYYTSVYLHEAPRSRQNIPAIPKPRYLGQLEDRLYKSTHRHKHHILGECETCDKCIDDEQDACAESAKIDCKLLGCHDIKPREQRDTNRETQPSVYFGRVGSGDTVMKSGKHRDEKAYLKLSAFEMEGSGVCGKIPCVVIKGVCDYADSHKNKNWQPYAAATAAACMKAFLKEWRPSASLLSHVKSLIIRDDPKVKDDPYTIEMIQSLFVVDPPAVRSEIERNRGPLLPTTGHWIFDSTSSEDTQQDIETTPSIYQRWLEDSDEHVLWIRGDPGKGKTMLSMSLIDNLQQRFESNTKKPFLGYFFCVYNDQTKNNVAYVIRCLLWQLLSQHSRLTIPFRRIYDTQAKEHLLSDSSAALSSLIRALDQILIDGNLRVYFVIDALDECSVESRDAFIAYLEQLKTSGNRSKHARIKWLITVRNDLQLPQNGLLINLEDHSDQLNRTITEYLAVKVEELSIVKSYKAEVQSAIKSRLSEAANGTFLYVSIVCQELRKLPTSSALKFLDELPQGLVPLYQRMLGQILDNEDFAELVPDALNVLQTMTVAPRSLTHAELAVISGLPDDHWYDEQFIADNITLCGSFFDVDSGLEQVTLIHPSVRDYLMPKHCPKPNACRYGQMYCPDEKRCRCSKRCLTPKLYPETTRYPFLDDSEDNLLFPVEQSQIHTNLAERCVDYLINHVFPESKRRKEESQGSHRDTDLLRHPFSEYALTFWTYHGRRANQDIKKVMTKVASSTFLLDWREAITSLRGKGDISPSRGIPGAKQSELVRIACYTGVAELVRVILDNGGDVKEEGFYGTSALHCAVEGGFGDVVQLLLERGAEVDAKTRFGKTAVVTAIETGHEAVLKLLLEANAQHSISQGDLGKTPLHESIDRQACGMAKLLIKHGASVSAMDNEGRTPLHVAAGGGYGSMERLMRLREISKGGTFASAGTFMTLKSKLNPEKQAQNRSFSDVVHLLIQHGADVSARDKKGHTPSHLAVDGGYEQVAQDLINASAEVDAADTDGWSPLHWAAEKGLANITRLLLRANADPNILDKFGRTVLHWAIREGHMAMVILLLEYGVRPNVMDTWSGGTALHIAVSRNSKDMVLLLLRHNADPNIQPEVPPSHAETKKAEYSNEPYPDNFEYGKMMVLMEKSAEEARSEWTPGTLFHHADEDMTRLLVEHGAEIDLQDNAFKISALSFAVVKENEDLSTPLHIAAAYGEKDGLERLLAKGADASLVDSAGMNALQIAEMREALYLEKCLDDTEHAGKVRGRFGPVKEMLELALKGKEILA
ncbi:hypothetical protein FGRMN_5652 [Fusarium graminum]|nr:hypothetical protein FGRMN_5652 [Fusarium graminum]